MIVRKTLFTALLSFSFSTYAGSIPGFENLEKLNRILSGEVLVERLTETKQETKLVVRSFFRNVTSDQYQNLVVDYEKYPQLFSQVLKGRTTSMNADRTQFTYALDIQVKVGPIKKNVSPEGRHLLYRSKLTAEEARVENSITNYTDVLETASQNVRLIPYQGGILVEDTLWVKMRSTNKISQLVKTKFTAFFSSYTEIVRGALKGD